ncbi:hypothetical protein FOIG_13358 [Fusarium odoratissimum NRRL 54006]|uniref:Metallo-beta-lactamase domain-containing protein n=1 Tax=Fusarium odoratissimum (strain NRRL 54006) TaxID=1089451 RepID=X0JBT2_FUSO5|nr:uncharacterized protein FOIG_13358 [Fusarium odoratissimum NRRL 54006]EXL93791.1 hypothetical protein FOIG_13358 [Fusarium odoratissimum NRRL 54006]
MATIPVTRLPNTSIAAMKCPPGTKMHILDLGTLQVDESWILRGANASALSNKNPKNKRRDLIDLSALIEYPGVGRTLFETECAENIDVELKHACWAVATGADLGVHMGHYLLLESLNWNTFNDSHLEIFQGISLHHLPGHTPELCGMQINLQRDGTFIWTTDQFHVGENYELGHPHGALARDHNAWYRSLNTVRRLQRIYNAKLIFGHDKIVAMEYKNAKSFYQ